MRPGGRAASAKSRSFAWLGSTEFKRSHAGSPGGLAGAARALRARALDLLDRLAKIVHALEVLVHRSEADVGDVVHFLQLAHHHLADHTARGFALTERQEALLDPVDRRVD